MQSCFLQFWLMLFNLLPAVLQYVEWKCSCLWHACWVLWTLCEARLADTNVQVRPLQGIPLSGVIWYQGETDAGLTSGALWSFFPNF